jgi:GTP-binding protein HflX
VGFVSDLPTQLVAAFRATLEEVTAADIILHVRDIAHPDTEAQRADVLAVLAEIGVGPEMGEGAPIIEVWNKLDALDPEAHETVLATAARDEDVVAISALTGEGIDDLRRIVSERLLAGARVHSIELPASDGGTIAWLHQHGEVIDQQMDGETLTMDVRLSPDEFARFQSRR